VYETERLLIKRNRFNFTYDGRRFPLGERDGVRGTAINRNPHLPLKIFDAIVSIFSVITPLPLLSPVEP
jgi:hypothetical protein